MGLGKGFKKAFAERIHGRVRKGRVIIKGKVDSWHLIADGDGSRKSLGVVGAGVDSGLEGTDSVPQLISCRWARVRSRGGAKASGRAIRVSCESGWRNNAYGSCVADDGVGGGGCYYAWGW